MKSDNLIQPQYHQIEMIEQQKDHEEEIEIITFIEYDVYEAAEKGEIKPAIEQRKDRLQSLLTPQKNTILHIYLTSKTSTNPKPKVNKFVERVLGFSPKTSKDPEPEIDEFVEAILGFCPPLLMQVNTKEETPLHIASRYGLASIVKQLIKHAKEYHPHDHHNQDNESRGAESATKMLRMASEEGDTALHEAVRFQHHDVMKILISEDGDFNHSANNSGETPLYMAVERGYNLIAEEIIEHCNSPATGGPTGRNVLHAATIRKDKGMMQIILNKFGEAMLKQADQNGSTPLHCAASMGNFEAVKMFLTKEMGREAAYLKNRGGNTALHLATVSKHRETMLEIIKRCPDSSELVNNRGWNILHFAVQDISFQSPVVEDILETRSSLSNLINEKDAQGSTPLHHIAVSINHWRLSRLIDDPRVDKLAYNDENKNALDLASTSPSLAALVNCFKKRLKTRGLRSGMRIYTPIEESQQDVEKERQVDHLKKLQDANVIVAALIATVTFAAGFTIPGGFVNEKGPLEGTPILGRNLGFRTFMVMDTIAMVLSTSSVLAHLFINADLKARHSMVLASSAFYLTITAMVAMVVAFATGIYAILGYSIAFSIAICVLALSFIIVFVIFFTSYVKGRMRKKTPLR